MWDAVRDRYLMVQFVGCLNYDKCSIQI
jgi:hypothetical protein